MYVFLSVERELEAYTKVLCGGGVGRRGEKWSVGLAVVVARECEVARHYVVGSEAYLQGFVSAGGLCECGLYVAVEGCLVTEGNIKSQVEVMADGGFACP